MPRTGSGGDRDRWGVAEELAFIGRLRTIAAVACYRVGLAQRVRDFEGAPMTVALRDQLDRAALARGTQLVANLAPDFVD